MPNFVTFVSVGAIIDEKTVKPIKYRNVTEAKEMASEIVERHGARPFGFYFITTNGEKPGSKEYKEDRSGMYYIGGVVKKIEELDQTRYRDIISALSDLDVNRCIFVKSGKYEVVKPFMDHDCVI